MLVNGFIIAAPVPPPAITGITPSGGSNMTAVSITNLSGINFNTTIKPSVKLNRTGNADIAATNVTALLSTQLTCTFDLTGQEAGSWNVVVTNPDGQEWMLANGFTVFPVVPTILPTISTNHRMDHSTNNDTNYRMHHSTNNETDHNTNPTSDLR